MADEILKEEVDRLVATLRDGLSHDRRQAAMLPWL